MSIATTIRTLDNFRSLEGCKKEDIALNEKLLELKFSKEYQEYLEEFALVSAGGHEFTGICNSEDFNVVSITKTCWEENPLVPKDFYVIEKTGCEDLVIWQSSNGEVFASQPQLKPEKICDSMEEYIKKY